MSNLLALAYGWIRPHKPIVIVPVTERQQAYEDGRNGGERLPGQSPAYYDWHDTGAWMHRKLSAERQAT